MATQRLGAIVAAAGVALIPFLAFQGGEEVIHAIRWLVATLIILAGLVLCALGRIERRLAGEEIPEPQLTPRTALLLMLPILLVVALSFGWYLFGRGDSSNGARPARPIEQNPRAAQRAEGNSLR